MITIRSSQERGIAKIDWLFSRHTFSFGNYHDPNFMGFSDLRVINEDQVQPAKGFGIHRHSDMEIISYVLEGALQHKDSIGTGAIIRPGDVQRMSAGTGLSHSEFNASANDLVHFLQIWILPSITGIEPSYEQKAFKAEDKQGKLLLVGSADGREGSITIHQDVNFYASLISKAETVSHALGANRVAWLQVASGKVLLNNHQLSAGDGAAITEEPLITLEGNSPNTEVLMFEMAA
jgi:quercetin 2,3-dioxygenase